MLARRRFLTAALLIASGLLGGGIWGAADARAADPVVFAAASTKDAMNDIAAGYAAAGKGKVVFSFGASGDLAKQIENGAPAAIFISADTKWADYLAKKNLLVAGSQRNLLGNHLVLIAPLDSTMAIDLKPGAPLAQALGDGKIAVCDPESVPAGRYAKASLIKLGIWDQVSPKVVGAKDVRAALALVELGEAPAGIVYSTDAKLSKKVRVVAVFPDDSHPKIVYPVALVAGQDTPEARAFYDYLNGPEAAAVFEKYGFILLH
jgi:molybdate transport system substrate-binding protein